MDNKEAIDILRLMMEVRMPEEVKAISMAEKALQKQILKEPYMYSDGYSDGNEAREERCPNCDYDFDGYQTNYCPECGQAINWSNI